MPRIFISYRRADSQAIAGRVHDRLVTSFGKDNVFKDVDRIPPGSTFNEILDRELIKCNVMLVIIGRFWVATQDRAERRLNDPKDFVRLEIEKGLSRSDMLIIPVLVDEASVPMSSELPDTIEKLVSLQVVKVRHDPDFHRDMDRLIDFLKVLGHQEEIVQQQAQHKIKRSRQKMFGVLGGVGTLLLGIFGLLIASGQLRIGIGEPTFDPVGTARMILTETSEASLLVGITMTSQARINAAFTEIALEPLLTPTALQISTLDPNATFAFSPSILTATHVAQEIVNYSNLLISNPRDFSAYNNRGLVYSSQGNLAESINDYSQAIEINPNYAEAYYNRGSAKAANGDLEGAIADYTQAIAIDPAYAEAYSNRGIARSLSGDLEGAIVDYTQAIEINPDYAKAYYNRGIARSASGDLEAAIADYTQAIAIDPAYVIAYYNRGSARSASGDLEGAIADYTQAIAIDPDYSNAYAGRGLVYDQMGNLSDALENYQLHLELAGENSLQFVIDRVAELEAVLGTATPGAEATEQP